MLVSVLSSLLLCLCTLCAAQIDLKTCGDEDSVVTCSFFFRKVDEAFRQENVLYTLRKAFFPTEGAPPFLFDVDLTLEIENVPTLSCHDDRYQFGDSSVGDPPKMEDVCKVHECTSHSVHWTHQWSKTIISYIIEREDLELLQDTNFVAFSAANFNSFDTSVFSDDEEEDLENVNTNTSSNSTSSSSDSRDSLSSTQDTTVQFQLTIPYLPCRPDDMVLLRAWEDILPWVSEQTQFVYALCLASYVAPATSSALCSKNLFPIDDSVLLFTAAALLSEF